MKVFWKIKVSLLETLLQLCIKRENYERFFKTKSIILETLLKIGIKRENYESFLQTKSKSFRNTVENMYEDWEWWTVFEKWK